MELVQIGTIYVDAGMIMIGDPCYTLPDNATHRSDTAKSWERFCGAMGRPGAYCEPLGSGVGIVVQLGDGQYPVWAEMDRRGVIGRVIIDLEPWADDDEDDWDPTDEI